MDSKIHYLHPYQIDYTSMFDACKEFKPIHATWDLITDTGNST